ncbi:RNA-binding domain-containing protein [Microvirga sp. Mcv34]|uniref:RNA-binding domain-containing protein n=1 Tax=Microvirga sp. Mcv34 TaxID=2926016 RepID=UPI0021C5F629|nr:RNA-binding domain-containing protein [Microvirga sp. Mcv34]
MDMSQERMNGLVSNPTEGLNIELKRWIDPKADAGIAKIARAAIALRNRNGGYLIIGFDDKTRLPDTTNVPADVRAEFHVDVIQGIVSRYASAPIEVQVAFAERNNQEFPIIGVPEGVTVPVAAKRDLLENGKAIIREDAVYFRTLGSNGTPSTSAIKAADWRELMDICFDNREADIGRFLRRQLGIEGAARFLSLITGVEIPATEETLESRTRTFLQASEQHRARAIEHRKLSTAEKAALDLGSWEVALLIYPGKDVSDSPQDFLSRVSSANPSYTGWPAWLVSASFRNKADRSYKFEGAWEQLIISVNEGSWSHFEFYRMHARGEFYQWRVLQDDFTDKVPPKTALEPTLVIYRVAEAIAVGLSLAKALEYDEHSTLSFLFRWKGLSGRELEAWAGNTYFSEGRVAHQDTAEGYVEVPLDTPVSAIAPYVRQATANLFSAFDGFEFPIRSVEQWVTKLLTRS